MRRAEIDGVPVFWVDGPPPLSAELIFGTGRRDESFARAGITHLVEHLIMAGLDRRHHYHNASVGIGSTSFAAAGRPEAVRTFLHDVCTSIREMPTDRLEIERKILDAEAGGGQVGLLGWHLLMRFGLRGPGLVGAEAPAVGQLGVADVRSWASRELVRSNAVLALSGSPPDGLRLDLPTGPRPVRPAVEPLRLHGAVWDWHPADRGVGLSLLVPSGPAAALAAMVLRRRIMDELRDRLGLAYDVQVVPVPVDADRQQLTVLADPAGRDAAAAARVVDLAVRKLRKTGPSPAELADELDGYREQAADPRVAGELAAKGALEHLRFGRDWHPAGELAALSAMTASDVQAALADYAATAILTVPSALDLRLSGFELRPNSGGRWLSGRSFRRRPLGPAPRSVSLIVGDEGVSLEQREHMVSIPWAELVGYGVHADGKRTLYGGYGTRVDVDPAHFLAGRRAVARIDRRVPAEVRFTERDR